MFKLKNIVFIIIGNFLLACSVQWFIVPYDIPVGGVTGLGLILSHLNKINVETIILIINLLCLPLAYFYSGKELMCGSILSSFIYPICLGVVKILPDLSIMSDSLLISAFLSGIISGVGIGFVLKEGASTGGLDIVTIIISKKLHINLSLVMWSIDTMIMIGQSMFVECSRIVYGIIGGYLMTKMIDRVINSGEMKYQITIISKYYNEIKNGILEEDEGVTLGYIESGLEGINQKAVMSIVSARKLNSIENLILEIDTQAFVTIHKIYDVKGRGFTSKKVYINR